MLEQSRGMKKNPSQGFTQVLSVCGLPVQGVLHLRSLPRGHLKFQHLRLKHSFRECVHEMPPDPAASTASWTQRAQAEIRVPRTVKQIPALSQKDIKAMMHTHTHLYSSVNSCFLLFVFTMDHQLSHARAHHPQTLQTCWV